MGHQDKQFPDDGGDMDQILADEETDMQDNI